MCNNISFKPSLNSLLKEFKLNIKIEFCDVFKPGVKVNSFFIISEVLYGIQTVGWCLCLNCEITFWLIFNSLILNPIITCCNLFRRNFCEGPQIKFILFKFRSWSTFASPGIKSHLRLQALSSYLAFLL